MADFGEMLHMKEAAARIGICKATLLEWVRSNQGPPYYRIGSRRYYDPAEIDAWIEARHDKPTR